MYGRKARCDECQARFEQAPVELDCDGFCDAQLDGEKNTKTGLDIRLVSTPMVAGKAASNFI